MKNIFKSFLKTYLRNWYQFLAFVIFIIISSALTIGFVSNSLQITTVATQIARKETKWDYSFGSQFGEFESQYVYDYFQNENGVINDLEEKLLNLEAEVKIEVDGKTFEKFNDYLQYAFDNYQKDFFENNYELYLANLIKQSVFEFNYLYDNQILLPKYQKDAVDVTVGFFQVVNQKWHFLTANYYGNVHTFLTESLIKKYNLAYPNNQIIFDLNFNLQYLWNTPQLGNAKINYRLEPINYHSSNNVIAELSDERLVSMKDDEILISNKFAQTHNLKIGDTIKINSAKMRDGDPENCLFSKQYKIIGYGIKTSNLFSMPKLNENLTNDDNRAFIYLTNKEMQKYVRYFWYYDNRWILPNNTEQGLEELPEISRRLRMNQRENLAKFNHFAIQELKARNTDLLIGASYETASYVIMLKVYLIQSIVLCFIGFFALILSLGFVNYCVKKELKQIASQLGLFKSMGYKNWEIASALWSRTFLTLILGFIFGYLVSIPIQIFVNHLFAPNFSVVIEEIWTNGLFLTATFCFVPWALGLINLTAIIRYLSVNSLLMMQMTGGSNIESNDKVLSWYKQKVQLKSLPWIKPVSVKQVTRFFLVPFFFIIGSLVVLFEFNIKTLVADLTDNNSYTYQKEIDHLFSVSKRFDWFYNSETKKYHLKNAEEYNLKTSEYHDLNDLIQKQNPEFNQLLNDYFDLERIEANKTQVLLSLLNILQTNINYQVFNFLDFEKLLRQAVKDYEQFFESVFPELKGTITLIKEQWVANFDQLNQRLINPNVQLTFNNLFLKQNLDYPIFKLGLSNEGYAKFASPTEWNLNLLNDSNQEVFLLDHYQWLKDESFWPTEPRTIPVLITNHFAKINEVKVGDSLKSQMSLSHDDSDLYLKVIGIETNDNATNNLYTSETFFKTLIGDQFNFPLYNSVFSKSQLFNFLNHKNEFRIQNDYFNFYFPTTSQTFNLKDIFETPQNLIDFINWNNINGKNFKSFTLEKRIAQEKVGEFTQLINLFLLFTFIVLFTLLVVIVIISSIDFKNEIKIFKAFGYTNNWINFKLLRKYLVMMIVGIIGASLITYFFWTAAIKLFYQSLKILVHNPFNYSPILILIAVMFGIFIICWFFSNYIIRKTKPSLQ